MILIYIPFFKLRAWPVFWGVLHSAGVLFDVNTEWYKKEVVDTLDVLASSGVMLEVNTRGLYKKKSNETYPSLWVLEQAYQRNIPVLINSDAHHPRELTMYFDQAAEIIKNAGYKVVFQLWRGEWREVVLP